MKGFRHDINAMRAVAIVGVVLFHYGLGLAGGFAGVDVFFVVSGYLMTMIIWGGLDAGRFDLIGFWAARARRIVPALAVLVLALLLFGLVWFDPLSLTELATEARGALLFFSNVQFWQQAGYFDAAAESKPLLHTWSLSVEWQFYLAYPILLMAVHRLAPRAGRHALGAVAALSFALAVFASTRKPDFTFYLLPTRAWEMALGGLPFVYAIGERITPRLRAGLAYGGLAVVVASLLLVDATWHWPAWATLGPTLGTVVVIAADHRDGALFRLPPVAALGRWSYSLYLWHWPVLVTLAYFDVMSPVLRAATLLPVLGVSALSYRVVEQGAMRWLRPGRPTVALGSAAAFAGVVALALLTSANAGFPTRFGHSADDVAQADAAIADWAQPEECGGINVRVQRLPECTLGQGTRKVMLFGDSYAEQLYPRLAALAGRDPSLIVHVVTDGGCPPLPGVNVVRPSATCALFNRVARDNALSGHYDAVVIASIWAPYFDAAAAGGLGAICFEQDDGACRRPSDKAGLEAAFQAGFDRLAAFVGALEAQGTQVVLVLPTPFPREGQRDYPLAILRRKFLGRDLAPIDGIDLSDFRRRTAYVDDQLKAVAARTGASLYDPAPSLCPDGLCPTRDPEGASLYMDRSHLRSSVVAAADLTGFDRMILDAVSRH